MYLFKLIGVDTFPKKFEVNEFLAKHKTEVNLNLKRMEHINLLSIFCMANLAEK